MTELEQRSAKEIATECILKWAETLDQDEGFPLKVVEHDYQEELNIDGINLKDLIALIAAAIEEARADMSQKCDVEEFVQVCECEYTREVDANGDQVVVMCNYHKEMGEYYTKGFKAGRESVRLPEKCNREYFPLSYGDGWDACLREIQRMNGEGI